jgi:hypothetical protein
LISQFVALFLTVCGSAHQANFLQAGAGVRLQDGENFSVKSIHAVHYSVFLELTEYFSVKPPTFYKHRKSIQTRSGTLIPSRHSYRSAQNDKAPAGYRQTGALGTTAQGVCTTLA